MNIFINIYISLARYGHYIAAYLRAEGFRQNN